MRTVIPFQKEPLQPNDELGEYQIIEFIERGTWTAVYKAKKKTDGSLWALKFLDPTELAKKQTEERGLSLEEIWRKESLDGFNTSDTNLAYNTLERVNGSVFLAEEYIDRFLSERIQEAEKNPFTLEEILDISQGMASGLATLHQRTGRAHCDFKPENIGYSSSRTIKISDYGTSTVYDSRPDAVRDNMGELLIRAPECYRKDSHPGLESDVWSFGAVVYKMITGSYLLEEKLQENNAFLAETDSFELGELVKKELKENVKNKKLRGLLEDCLTISPYSRIRNGLELQTRVEETIDGLQRKDKLSRALNSGLRKAPWVLGGAILAAAFSYMIENPPEPRKHSLPTVRQEQIVELSGIRYADKDNLHGVLFEREDLDLPELPEHINKDNQKGHITNHPYVAALLTSYENAISEIKQREVWEHDYLFNETQYAMLNRADYDAGYGAYRHINMIASIIEKSIALLAGEHDSVDLEDVCTTSVVGTTAMYQAKIAVGSEDFKDYISARDKYGELIIPEKEAEFIKTWVTYAHQRAKDVR
jgi:serine/threonine protein kinase